MPLAPGSIRDAIITYLRQAGSDASLAEVSAAVAAKLGTVPASSIRSYLNLNVPGTFVRTEKGRSGWRRAATPRRRPRCPAPCSAAAMPASTT